MYSCIPLVLSDNTYQNSTCAKSLFLGRVFFFFFFFFCHLPRNLKASENTNRSTMYYQYAQNRSK